MCTKHGYVDLQGRHSRSKNISGSSSMHIIVGKVLLYASSTHPLFHYNLPKTWTLNTFPIAIYIYIYKYIYIYITGLFI